MSEAQVIRNTEVSDDSILVVATGGSSGLGFKALVDFARQAQSNIILVLGCRTPVNNSVLEAFNNISKITKLDVVTLDLADLNSTQYFVSYILQTYSQKISVLLLCAGAVHGQRSIDLAGNEKTIQVNALSQAFLLRYLWPRLVDFNTMNGAATRVVFVASSLHKSVAQEHRVLPSNIDELVGRNHWKTMLAYSLSKLVQMHLFQIVVDSFAKVEHTGPPPIAIAVSPGFVPQTGLIREYPWWTRLVMTYVMPWMPFATTLERGSGTIIKAMTDDLESGSYISPRGNESLASECMDSTLRSEWRDWLIAKGVWADNL